ncbi:MAG: hypothetical protein KC464_27060 [Myxococcales bacterium]|nr:hypothetical protein [Myxococcales bacterium]
MTLREAIAALGDRTYEREHHVVLDAALKRLSRTKRNRRAWPEDLVQDFQVWLLAHPDECGELLTADDASLPGHLARRFGRFVFERDLSTAKGILRKALDSAVRSEPRIDSSRKLLRLSDRAAGAWPHGLWASFGRFDHSALKAAAVAALTETGCPMSRGELTGLIFERYNIAYELSADPRCADDAFRIRMDARLLVAELLEFLSRDEITLLAAALKRGHRRGRPSRVLEEVKQKVRAWTRQARRAHITARTWERVMIELGAYFASLGLEVTYEPSDV